MIRAVITGFIVALCLLIIPLISIKPEKNIVETAAFTEVKKDDTTAEKTSDRKIEGSTFLIKTGSSIIELTARDYIIGVVSAEMPASFNTEALKAQSVAAYTFALYRKRENRYDGFDLTDSFETDQSFLDEESRREKWKEAYEEKNQAVSRAVDETLGEYLSFDNKPALTLYHALSGGITNRCSDVFGGDLPYLISVDSEGDKLSPDYKSVFSFNENELKSKLSAIAKTDSSGENLFKDIQTAESGLVLSLSFAGKSCTGGKISSLLSLPSASFTVEYADSGYIFTCVGRGHGVGMSQYGAEAMAKGGASYKEILAHYYPGTELVVGLE